MTPPHKNRGQWISLFCLTLSDISAGMGLIPFIKNSVSLK
jgi:hypothetical protein